MQASDWVYNYKIRVTWSSSIETTRYEVWRNTLSDSASALPIASTISGSSYDDTSVVPGVIYYYWVKACNNEGCSDFSKNDTGYLDTGLNVAVSSELSSLWSANFLIDGDFSTIWSSKMRSESMKSSEWAAVILPRLQTIARVHFYPYQNPLNPNDSSGFPTNFVIQYAFTGDGYTCNPDDPRFSWIENWRPLAILNGYPRPSSDPIDFYFLPVQAQCIRFLGTRLSQDDYGFSYFQLNEFEIYDINSRLP